MSQSIMADFEHYRLEAAKRYREYRESQVCTPVNIESNVSDQPVSDSVYKREKIPGLDQYLQKACSAYYRAKSAISKKRPRLANKLGHGEPAEHLFASIRKDKWMRRLAEQKHRLQVMNEAPFTDFVKPCRIPTDILRRAASRFSLYKQRLLRKATLKSELCGSVLGRLSVCQDILPPRIRNESSYAIHVSRCEEILLRGENTISARIEVVSVVCDTFEDVRRRYKGRPDEIYRRKTARKYATWKRMQREQERLKKEGYMKAENEMKRRRGHDQLLTSRPTGDASFAPFLYELNNNTYAYSSKITEAPKLRKIMIDKYTGDTDGGNQDLNQWQRAQQAAETNPLFHTRVMNRFS